MNTQFLKDLMPFLSDIKRRNTIVASIGMMCLIVLIILVQFISPKRSKTFQGKAKIESTQAIRSIPGGLHQKPSQEYRQLQQEHNQQQSEQAAHKGQSFIATIVDGTKVESPAYPENKQAPFRSDAIAPLQQPSNEVQAVLARQDALLSEQKTQLLKQELQGVMHQQAAQLVGVWSSTPIRQEVAVGIEDEHKASEPLNHEDSDLDQYLHTPIKAGNILRGILLTSVNSDAPGPILAKITSGVLKDAKLIGTLSYLGERVLIKFYKMNLPNCRNSISINAVAVDAHKADTALASETDRHLMLRYGSLFASGLFEGYGIALQRSANTPIDYYDPIRTVEHRESSQRNGQQTINDATTRPAVHHTMNHSGQWLGALGQVGSHFSAALARQFHTPTTVHVYAGTGIGVLLMEDLHNQASQRHH